MKFENTINIDELYAFSEKYRDKILKITNLYVDCALHVFNTISNSHIVIYAKSISFRIGKSSVKTIIGFENGFKCSYKNIIDHNILDKVKLSKEDILLIFLYKILIIDRTRIYTESDKTEKQESAETIRTIHQINNLMSDKGYLDIILHNNIIRIDGFRQLDGRPKADMSFTYKGKDVIYVSHKLGSCAGNFQQYGGLSNDLGYTKNKRISSIVTGDQHLEILNFLENVDHISHKLGAKCVDNMYDIGSLKKGNNFAKKLENIELSKMCMFGNEYQYGALNENNVHIIIDGNIQFIKEQDCYRVDGTYHTMINPIITEYFEIDNEIYSPMIFVMRSSAQGLNQGGFINARVVIWPNNNSIQKYVIHYTENMELL